MKPPEILGMLEEAAGTRMYEMKKDAALRTLEKKQVKVEEINAVRARLRGTLSRVHTQRSRMQASLDDKAQQTCLQTAHPSQGLSAAWFILQACSVAGSQRLFSKRQVLKEEILQACTVAEASACARAPGAEGGDPASAGAAAPREGPVPGVAGRQRQH